MADIENWVIALNNCTLSVLPFDYVRQGVKVVESTYSSNIGTGRSFEHGLAAFAALVYRLTGDEDIVLGTDTSDNKPYVFRTLVTGETTLEKVYNGARAPVTPVDYTELTEAVEHSPLFRTAFLRSQSTQGLFGSSPDQPTDLNIYFNEATGDVTAHYNSLLFKRDRLAVLVDQLKQLVHSDINNQIGKISLITEMQKPVLPDPTTDLHWSNYRGAIHEIFAKNAAAHPDRACVVEPQVSYSYRAIDEASNVLAHHLVQSGVVVGDVVMVYAYRGVDLVVAVMGVLKAGATFSVIDPAYPPARQNIYLQVAKPQALVVLRKAGELADDVVQYIQDNLQLKTQVPALEIHEDGSVTGSRSGDDILASAQQYKSQQTGVEVGPDCNPTLSFTSGSEGVPKGVKGRHFSLAYYFPWMAERFGLSEKDKFTMLSGIAHDPIQRDIFTPLFLGAQLLVPTSDDIGTPGQLAEWMGNTGATVTHLTPAMGQLLSAQATAEIPTLHHAFFVGDILTKRDCMRLQALARNVAIVNMYGTTETQRSVSYFEVAPLSTDPAFLKSEKDVMPAGQGMVDVQLLVVNRNDRKQTCGVGEVGEIYVRAGGLAEGYLQLPELTAEKFVKNWFTGEWPGEQSKYWFGPRDRLYRTGDLGRYRPDGNVECCGRADDQVKIRGFRIELGEIDTNLSQHPNVRENVTLVRRDKDEEAVLISYIVPQNAESFVTETAETDLGSNIVRYQSLIKDIKAYLKAKLASYAVPTIILPLNSLPLNPNGKVDKPALPFPDTAKLAGSSSKEFSTIEAEIRDLWLDILPQKPASVDPNDSFFDLGGHSILATRMIFELRKKLGVEVPLGLIFKEPTIQGFSKEIEKIKQGIFEVESKQEEKKVVDYGADADELAAKLPQYQLKTDNKVESVFLTGATGFLGSFVLRDLLQRGLKVFAHVRAADSTKGLERIKNTAIAYGIWDDTYEEKIVPVIGNLEHEHFGLVDAEWSQLCNDVDAVVHNGALVHWVYPYETLRGPNVIATINVMELCASGKPKFFTFVSSTSTIDVTHYVQLSDSIVSKGGEGLPESDDLEGSRTGLGNGYGQSKWAAEHLIRKAQGLVGTIIRPGYVTGDTNSGVSSTDDFLLRMVKGCIQLGIVPDIHNTVNMVPVDHVARVVTSCGLHPANPDSLCVAQITSHPRLRFNEYLGALREFGYKVETADYIPWRVALETYVEQNNDNALYPLLHFVLDDLPQSTKAPELDDTNARASLKKDAQARGGKDWSAGCGVDSDLMGVYLSWLVAVGFLPPPPQAGARQLPKLTLDKAVLERLANVGGRSSK